MFQWYNKTTFKLLVIFLMNSKIIETFLKEHNLNPIFVKNGFDFYQDNSEIRKFISSDSIEIKHYIFENEKKDNLYVIANNRISIFYNALNIVFFDSDYNVLGDFRNFLKPDSDSTNRYVMISEQQYSFDNPIISFVETYKKNVQSVCLQEDIININEYDIGLLSVDYTNQNTIKATIRSQYIENFLFDLSGNLISCRLSNKICNLWNIVNPEIKINDYNSLIKKTKNEKEIHKLVTDESIVIMKKSTFSKIIESVNNVHNKRNIFLKKDFKKHYHFIFENFNHENFNFSKDFEVIRQELKGSLKVLTEKKISNTNARKATSLSMKINILEGICILDHFKDFLFGKEFRAALDYINKEATLEPEEKEINHLKIKN